MNMQYFASLPLLHEKEKGNTIYELVLVSPSGLLLSDEINPFLYLKQISYYYEKNITTDSQKISTLLLFIPCLSVWSLAVTFSIVTDHL